MVQPWLEAGYEAITVDLQEADHGNKARHHFVADVTAWRYPLSFGPPSIVFAFPPCTHLASSGARWFKDKGLRSLIDALRIVDACRDICESSGAPYMIENPVGTLATYWRKPDRLFNPFDYSFYHPEDNYTKKTCLWIGGGFVMPPVNRADLPPPDDRIHKRSPGPDRADFRSATPKGFAHAVFKANAPQSAQMEVA
jgi:hypothetical protein